MCFNIRYLEFYRNKSIPTLYKKGFSLKISYETHKTEIKIHSVNH